MPCALPIVDPPIAERTQPPPIDLPPRGIQRCDDPRVGFGVTQKEAKASAMAAAREYHGIIKSNQRWSGPDSVNSAGSLGLLWNALMSMFFLRGQFPL